MGCNVMSDMIICHQYSLLFADIAHSHDVASFNFCKVFPVLFITEVITTQAPHPSVRVRERKVMEIRLEHSCKTFAIVTNPAVDVCFLFENYTKNGTSCWYKTIII